MGKMKDIWEAKRQKMLKEYTENDLVGQIEMWYTEMRMRKTKLGKLFLEEKNSKENKDLCKKT